MVTSVNQILIPSDEVGLAMEERFNAVEEVLYQKSVSEPLGIINIADGLPQADIQVKLNFESTKRLLKMHPTGYLLSARMHWTSTKQRISYSIN